MQVERTYLTVFGIKKLKIENANFKIMEFVKRTQ